MSRPSHREAFHGKKAPSALGAHRMEGQLKALIPPPAASQREKNAAPITPGPGLHCSLEHQANKSSLVGTLAFLGPESVHPAGCWVKESQPLQLNSGAHNHPVLILARQDNLVLCAQCTSWNGKTPQERFSNTPSVLDDVLHSYMELLPIDSPADCATQALGGLLHSGRRMEKRTFVSLQRAFWTEAHLLGEYVKGGSRRLTADSVAKACWAYTTAHAWRQQQGVSEDLPNTSRTPGPTAAVYLSQCGDGVASWRPMIESARWTTTSKGGIAKTGGKNWRAKSEGERRRSGGFTGRESWRVPQAAG